MKEILIALCAILAVTSAKVIISAKEGGLLGRDECTWGPSYWCENLKTAKQCNNVKHCIGKYWEQMEVPEDNDSVCGICKDMVKQARDQLESNQTQQDLKDVFEGSCKLIHIKSIVDECIKIVDQFIPELVETLASQMNPSVVCSVAGLCNNAHIDKLLTEYQTSIKKDETKLIVLKNDELEPDECTKCYTIAKYMENKLHRTPQNTMLLQFLNICGQLSSYSDSCSAIVMKHFDVIYNHLQDNFNADNICHLSGQCSSKYHKHENSTVPQVEITPLSSVGMVEVEDDLPCKLCEQLVGHLKDLLVANTTEIEFKEILLGICKQTKSFADECKAIIEEYYVQIYEYLTKGLNSNVICQMSGICPNLDKTVQGPIWPLVPIEVANVGMKVMEKIQPRKGIEVTIGKEYPKSEAEEMQLPLERLMPLPLVQSESVNGKKACTFCEYLLHYIQDAITNPVTEEKMKEVLGKICTKIPSFIEGECEQFVNTYGDAVVAILVQEIDPSQVCPMLHICPSEALLDIWEKIPKEFIITEEKDKPGCALCLLAVQQIYNAIENNRTEANIKAELDKLCNHLPRNLVDECTDFVKAYSDELIEMILTDLSPQEVCEYLRLCVSIKDPGPKHNYIAEQDGEILTNEIPEYPLHIIQPTNSLSDTECVICEFVMKYIDKEIGNKEARDKIEKVVHGVCNHLPKTVAKECNDFVNNYADTVIKILSEDVSPKEACSVLGLCTISMIKIQESITECALCRAIISQIDKLLGDSKVDAEIEEIVKKVCKYLPTDKQDMCNKMVNIYGPSIINMLKDNINSEQMCSKMALCSSSDYLAMSLVNLRVSRSIEITESKKCTWGEDFVCKNEEIARLCNVTKQCEDRKNGGVQ
ncbi:PREDICTED: proactivator polypeptide-like [Acromyrmex echinatior]|uniref:Proactivator polypeptide n=1 Tax=Acromyrmex echinatior TaxID=103372 RepID=F4WW78_ACREC|nr:PREDICTED: proactivator polypeptide-like [Acromyrmex echinatior]EGI61549.1 Proactivator polypeptide [Acromyrmex echinatior]